MKTIRRKPASHAPQRRNRGTTRNTALKVSTMPSPMAKGRLRVPGTSISFIRTAAPYGSVIFQTPARTKKTARMTAEETLRIVFHAGSSKGRAWKDGCAILSSMFFILAFLLYLAPVTGIAQTADLLIENAHVYTVNPAQPTASAVAVKDSKILAVGNDLSKYAGPATK